MMENPQNSLLSMFCIKKIRKGIRREDELAEVTICYSSPNPNLTMKCFIDRNDKRQGKFTVFDGEAPIITGTFEDDLMKDLITVRNRNGNIVFDGFYRNGKKEGMGTEYVAGVRSFRGNFYNDKRNGPGDVFDSSGQIISSKFYYDGIETPNYVEGDILYVYDEHNCLIKAGEFNPVSFRLDGKGVLYTPGNHNAKLWKAGIFTNGDLDILEREFHDSGMIEYKEQKKIYEGGYWSSNVKEFHRFGDGIEYYDNGAVCVTYYNMNGPHGYFIRGPTIERLLELSIEDIIYNLVDADDCSVCKYENGKMIENWHVLKRRKKADCCSNCCVKTCVCIPKRKKYDASVWLMEHWYLHVIMISLFVGLLIYLLICILKQDCYHGKLVINNDYSWEGQICNEKAYGFGKMYLKNHLYYEGYVVNNMYHGYGNSYYMNGQKEFDGIWHLNSKLNGSYYSEDGYLLYTGLFDVDKYNGFGIAYYPTGTIQYIGEWLNNKIIQGKYFNLLNQTVYEGDFSTSSLINQGCIYYHTGTIMYNFTWDRSNILVGSYYSLIDHFIVNDGYELDMYFKQVYSYEDYAEVDYLIGYFDMKVYDQSSFFDICYYSFLYLLRIDSYIMSHFNSFSIYNNTLLYSITFYSSSSLSFLSDINSVYIFDNPSLSILIFDENTVTDGEVLYLNSILDITILINRFTFLTYSCNRKSTEFEFF